MSGQDEPNPVLWLATWAGRMARSCRFRTTCCVLQENSALFPYNKSFIDQACLVKMAGCWSRSFFACLWTSTSSRCMNMQKKNLANSLPAWSHAWPITHTYFDMILKQILIWRGNIQSDNSAVEYNMHVWFSIIPCTYQSTVNFFAVWSSL